MQTIWAAWENRASKVQLAGTTGITQVNVYGGLDTHYQILQAGSRLASCCLLSRFSFLVHTSVILFS